MPCERSLTRGCFALHDDAISAGTNPNDDGALGKAVDALAESRLGSVATQAPALAAVLRAYRAALACWGHARGRGTSSLARRPAQRRRVDQAGRLESAGTSTTTLPSPSLVDCCRSFGAQVTRDSCSCLTRSRHCNVFAPMSATEH